MMSYQGLFAAVIQFPPPFKAVHEVTSLMTSFEVDPPTHTPAN